MTMRPGRLLSFALAVAAAFPLPAQSLPDSLVQRVLQGPARVIIAKDAAVVPLVGAANVPQVEAMVNGAGPYRLLIDLGANVTLLRRNVVDASRSTVLVERQTSDIVRVDLIQLGQVRLENVVVGSYDELDVDGVIGYNALQSVSFTLDFPGRRLELHRRSLPPADGRSVFVYQLQRGLPYVVARVGSDTLSLNLDTGASEWMTIPPALQSRYRWSTPPAPGRVVSNNQTGRTQILEGRLADTLTLGALRIPSALVYVNPDAEVAWLGASAMLHLVWTFDPARRLVRISRPK